MSADRWELRNVLFAGVSTFGKSTAVMKYLVTDRGLTTRFIFDPHPVKKMADAMRLDCAETEDDLWPATEEGFACFDPGLSFPGDKKPALEWFARWAYERAQLLPGRKALVVDEVWRYQSAQTIPQPLAEWIQDGAKFGMECLFATQVPNKLNSAITANLSEIICFRLQERNALDWAEDFGFDREELRQLQQGKFVALNLFSGGFLRGQVF